MGNIGIIRVCGVIEGVCPMLGRPGGGYLLAPWGVPPVI